MEDLQKKLWGMKLKIPILYQESLSRIQVSLKSTGTPETITLPV